MAWQEGRRRRRLRWAGLTGRLRDVAIARALARAAQDAEIEEVAPREYGALGGPEVRAWRVRMRRTGCVYRVSEHPEQTGYVRSDRGCLLACDCTTSRIQRGYCPHTVRVARLIGGRDLVAEAWAAQEHRLGGAR